MKQYRVTRSIYGELGSLRRGEVLPGDDPRIVNNSRHVKDLVARKLLVAEDEDEKPDAPKGKAKGGRGDSA
ncbi:hypothetical protein SAMN02745157_1521 [Kaistia soli DSM 19436]|uniref:Uncharacterized protein n=1 Tax=Kaistia soli DSM 19436 TaxID=1122133 RepID=A0A1M4YH57_9HYPH|nr:hypothetical protein [Kaistia soli]SHF05125.1 hypothetical protein SAMN02745157_1521 [Kaistia soli DSM 19436]